jgi:bacterioferritin (cytochrome b1)
MSSKFFAQGDNSSSDEEPEEKPQKPTKPTFVKPDNKKGKKGGKKDDEDDEKDRVVRSEKAKRLANLIKITQNLKQLVKIEDYERILADYEGLQGEIKKAQKLIDEDGYPSEYLKAMCTMEV